MTIDTDERSHRAASRPQPIQIASDRCATATITLAVPDEALIAVQVVAGHLPSTARRDLVDAIFAHPAVESCRRIRAVVPLGDFELLDGFVRYCRDVRTRAAGASCLVDARRDTD